MFLQPLLPTSSLKTNRSLLNRALFTGAILVAFFILQAPAAVAGTGTFRDGKFNFCVSIRFNASAAEIQRIKDVFEVANQVLYDATDGQHRFGTISLINNSGASDQADFWIYPGGGRGNAGGLLAYGIRGRHINLYNASFFVQPDTMRDALLIVHEFAHFTYGVDDEYRGPFTATGGEPFAACPGDDRNSSTLNYCIMDNISAGARRLTNTYSVNEFCVKGNHDKPLTGANPDQANDTAQSATNRGESCWETMSNIQRKWRLNAPTNLPQDTAPAPPPPVVFDTTCVGQGQRVVLLIDRSGSMAEEGRLTKVKSGASNFIDLYGEGDSLGVVSFATAASVDFPLAAMNTGNRSTAKTAVNSLTPNGLTNLPDGLTLALSQLNASSCPDCQKTIILLSDGDSNVGPPPESMIGTLQNADVKVIALTVGNISVAGEASLKTIATQTGGLYFRGKEANDFVNFLVNLAYGTSPYKAVSNAPQQLIANQVKEIPVLIEPGVASTSFAISLFDPTDPVTVSLRDPSGDVITESNAPFGQFTSSSGLKIFKIPTPETGTWTIVLSSGTLKSGKVDVLTYSQHDGTDFWASFDDDNVTRVETLSLHAAPTHDGKNVTGATVTGEVVHPNGTKTPITLFDDGAPAHGDVHAADGTYSALFNSYSGTGTYTFNLKYENTSGLTYVGEPIPDENGVVPSFTPTSVPAATRITTITAVVSSVTDVVWFDDTLPEGATAQAEGNTSQGFQEAFAWVDSNPAAYSGQLSHQSRHFGQQGDPPDSVHGHSFDGAARRLTLGINDKLFTYVFLDLNNMPREIMLEFKDTNGWEHRAYWGDDRIQRGVNGTSSRWSMGPLPKPGHWERLEVWASDLGLVGSSIDGMSFVVERGRATWDLAGKSNGPGGDFFPPSGSDENWIDGAVPQGATATHSNDQWLFAACPTAGGSFTNLCHQSVLPPHADPATGGLVRYHEYTGGPPKYINKGDILFAYVFLDDVIMPNQLFIRWHDGTNWRAAYWGSNWREVGGLTNRENWRYMGGLPTFDKWVRLEIPANYLGLEGRYVTGMSFGFFKEDDNAQIVWGRAGKTAFLSTAPAVLSPLSRVWSYVHPKLGFYYQLKDVKLHSDDVQRPQHFFAYPHEAAGTKPMYEYINKTKREFFYSTCKGNGCTSDAWQLLRVAFYVYLTPAPGTVPLYLYHNSATQYFMTTDPNEAGGRILDSDHWAYVYPTNPTVPVQPTNLKRSVSFPSPCRLSWLDNSNDEDGFRIRRYNGVDWVLVASVGPNVTSFEDCNIVTTFGNYAVHAYNSVGESFPSNLIFKGFRKLCKGCLRITDVDAVGDELPVSDDPTVRIPNPLEGAVVGRDVAIVADAFDEDGNGSIGKVEFYDGAQKIGELNGIAPYNFTWFNAPLGPHTLTVVARDNAGATATSAPVHITVSDVPLVTLTSPTDGAVISGPTDVTLQATASDPDGSVAKVEFYSGATKIGEDTSAPYSFSWNSVPAGTYDLTARVIDNLGLAVTSDIVTLTVNLPPTVSLTAPTDGQVVLAPANVTLSATAADQDGTVSKVDFYAGTTLIGTKTSAPFTYDWTGVSAGTYGITAKATDDRGTITTSALATLIVNSAPSVSITSPTNRAMLAPFSNAVINATASDSDGTITKVDFYQGSNLIGTDTTSPFSFDWNNLAPASYVLTAKATDNRGAVTTSAAIAVTTPTFFDDFNDNSLNAVKWSVMDPTSSAIVSEQAQQLRITLPASTATYNGVVSNATYDIRGAIVQVEQPQAVSQAGWAEDYFMIQKDANNYLLMHTGAGTTMFRQSVNGAIDQVLLPFDPVAHRHWRLRHVVSSNSVIFESSADGINWTTQMTRTAGFALSSLRFYLFAGAYGTGNANPGAAIYNDFQFISPVAAILSDDFNDNALDTVKWTANDLFSGITDTALPLNETGQRLEIGPLLQNTSGSHYRGIRTVDAYDFTNAASYVELVQPASATTTAYAMFTVGKDVDNFYRLYVSNGSLVGERKTFGTKVTLFTIPYDAVAHRYLRIRHEAGSMIMDTAPSNGAGPGTWSPQYMALWSNAVSLNAIRFEMKAGTSVAEANAPGLVIFDNFAFTRSSQSPAPTLTTVSPTFGNPAGGTGLSVVGTGFQLGATVSVGGVSATNVTVLSATNISATAPAHAAGPVSVTVSNPDGQSATLVNGFLYTTQTVLLEDNFNDNNLNSQWTANDLFSGTTDTSLPINETAQQLEIGPLLQNTGSSHYRGVRSVNTYDFTNGAAYVELVQPAAASTTAYAMFTVGKDVDNYYRLYVSNGSLVGEYKVAGTKVTLFTISFDAVNHRYLRIRHQAGGMIMETAPASGSAPGNWTQQYSQMWSSAVTVTTIRFEMKGGTSVAEANAPGKVIFDNFMALR